MDMNLSKLWEMMKDREAQRAAVHGVTKSLTRLRAGLSSYSLEFLRSKFPVPDNFPGQPHRAAYDADVTFSLFSMAMNILCGDPRQDESAGN